MAAFKQRLGPYKFGIVVLFIATLALLTGVIAPYWGTKTLNIDVNVTGMTLTAVVDLNEGPWLLCVSDDVKSPDDTNGVKVEASSTACGLFHLDLETWFHVTRAAVSVGVVLALVACLVAMGTNCCRKNPMPRHRMIEVLLFFSGMLSIAAVAVYNVFRKDNGPATSPVTFNNYNISTAILAGPFWTNDWAMYLTGASAVILLLDSLIIAIYNKKLGPSVSDAWFEDGAGRKGKHNQGVVASRYKPYGEFYDRRARQGSKKDRRESKKEKMERKESKKEKQGRKEMERQESKKEKQGRKEMERQESKKEKQDRKEMERRESKKEKQERKDSKKKEKDPNPYPYPPNAERKVRSRHNSRDEKANLVASSQQEPPFARGPQRYSDGRGKGKGVINMDPNYFDAKGHKGVKKSRSDPSLSRYDAPLPNYNDLFAKRNNPHDNSGLDYGKENRPFQRLPEPDFSPYDNARFGKRNTSYPKLQSAEEQVKMDRWNSPRDGGYTGYSARNATGHAQIQRQLSGPDPGYGGLNKGFESSPDFRGMTRGLRHSGTDATFYRHGGGFDSNYRDYPNYGGMDYGYGRDSPSRGGGRAAFY